MNIKQLYLKQRFYPNLLSLLINPFYFTRKGLLNSLSYFSHSLKGRLLDFGCGSKPYKSLFSQAIEYIGVDVENEGHNHDNEDVDFYYDGITLPFEKETFDSILCSEVLEHVPNLDAILDELNRVLVSDGKLLVTVPFVWPEHELPFDFRRFTVNGLTQVMGNHGFKVQEVMTSGGFIEVITQLWMMYLHNGLYGRNRYLNILKNILFLFPSAFVGLICSFIFPNVKGLYLNVTLLARKK
ncbi:bifunctional 2-polyprenyl-6-hydroxyphenol methylase/3-demethylubiquinol 3-O-methyltransferase UbiG [uncultured Parabacteroides sp.]|uniref:class I SAM-dependent methyltransferase n=1 Tax=uncultured Parabacteroides sp. TaxID=512312 RepID=UPI0026597AA5|nr:class I SAM-dependent methyltransferase [uncultured Parabacteroides sp.]